MDIISVEIDKLIQKGVISVSDLTPQDFFSTLFVRPKKDWSYRTGIIEIIENFRLNKVNIYIIYFLVFLSWNIQHTKYLF